MIDGCLASTATSRRGTEGRKPDKPRHSTSLGAAHLFAVSPRAYPAPADHRSKAFTIRTRP